MLRELEIKNLAIIRSLRLEWRSGFTAVTGETGAGKSVLMRGFKLLLGEKAQADWVRPGAPRLGVCSVFDLPGEGPCRALLQSEDLWDEGGELVLERQVSAEGKSRCRINGSGVTLSLLGRVTRHLLDLHGQHQQQKLLKESSYLGFLDAYGNLKAKAETVKKLRGAWREQLKSLDDLKRRVGEIESQRDFYTFQWEELNKAKLRAGEEDELESRLHRMASAEKIQAKTREVASLLEGDSSGLLPGAEKLLKKLGELQSLDPSRKWPLDSLEELVLILRQVSGDLEWDPDTGDSDLQHMDALNERLSKIQALKSKYKTDEAGLIALREERRSQLDSLDNVNGLVGDAKEAVEISFNELMEEALELSGSRRKVAKTFEKAVGRCLHSLGMPESTFLCHLESLKPEPFAEASMGESGLDRLQFLFSGNPGLPAKPLKQVISGGEASRLMLAIKSVLARADDTPLLIFDEIDTGIGGKTAHNVGEALKALSKHHQVIAITHLHQVAGQADAQYSVVKEMSKDAVHLKVLDLERSARVKELARMMGDESSRETTKHAEDLLQRSGP